MPLPTTEPITLESAVKALQLFKAKEDEYRTMRINCEVLVARFLPSDDLEGTTSAEVDGLKVKVVRKLNRTIDEDEHDKWTGVLGPVDPIIYKPALDLKKLRAIELGNPEMYKVCQKFITVKPAKISVTVEEV